MIYLKNSEQIKKMQIAGRITGEALLLAGEAVREGVSTLALDKIIRNHIEKSGAKPSFLGYGGFPASACISVNDEVIHGIPSAKKILKEGDIVNVDVSTIYKGYYSDANRMFIIGETTPERKRLVEVAKECLEVGLAAIRPWGFLGDIGAAIQEHAEANGCSVVTKFGGHGCGVDFHEEPFVPHVGKKGTGCLLVPGMTFTVEPMINAGDADLYIDKDNGWTAYTKDGKDSAQWEHHILITEDGFEILSY